MGGFRAPPIFHIKKFKKMKYDIISPDGFSIHYEDQYKTKKEALQAFKQWQEGYKRQGYYSSVNYGRIPLENLFNYCQLVKIKD